MKTVKLSKLHSDPRSANHMSPERREKLKANYKIHKRFPSLIVRPHPDETEDYIIIDGHQRLEVAKALKLKTLYCEVWEVDDKQAG